MNITSTNMLANALRNEGENDRRYIGKSRQWHRPQGRTPTSHIRRP